MAGLGSSGGNAAPVAEPCRAKRCLAGCHSRSLWQAVLSLLSLSLQTGVGTAEPTGLITHPGFFPGLLSV